MNIRMKNESKISNGMKVGIIVEPYEERNASGIAQCILKQAEGLLELDKEHEYIVYTSTPFKKERLPSGARNVILPRSFLGKNIWFIKNSIFNKSLVSDVLIFNMPLLPLVLPKRIKAIPIFYELVYESPGGINLKNRILMALQKSMIATALSRAVHVLTPSEATRRDVLGKYKIEESKISVSYPGYQDFDTYTDSSPVEGLNSPYFLFIGKIKFKKNTHNIVRGFVQFKNKYRTSHKLYLAGVYGGEYYEGIKKYIAEEGLDAEVIFGGFVSNDEVYRLYKNAEALVFCTLKEGFGMPVIEAMDLGIPVITSDQPPLNEVAGGAALLVDPENVDEIAGAMFKISNDSALRSSLIEKGREHARNFSWEKHIQEIYNTVKASIGE